MFDRLRQFTPLQDWLAATAFVAVCASLLGWLPVVAVLALINETWTDANFGLVVGLTIGVLTAAYSVPAGVQNWRRARAEKDAQRGP